MPPPIEQIVNPNRLDYKVYVLDSKSVSHVGTNAREIREFLRHVLSELQLVPHHAVRLGFRPVKIEAVQVGWGGSLTRQGPSFAKGIGVPAAESAPIKPLQRNVFAARLPSDTQFKCDAAIGSLRIAATVQNEGNLGHPMDLQRRVEPSIAGLGFRFDPAGEGGDAFVRAGPVHEGSCVLDREGADLVREQPEFTLDRPLNAASIPHRLDFRLLHHPKNFSESDRVAAKKLSTKTAKSRLPTKLAKSTGPENIGLERTDFGSVGMGEVGSLSATSLENNEKFRSRERSENELRQEVGGGTGAAVEQSLVDATLICKEFL